MLWRRRLIEEKSDCDIGCEEEEILHSGEEGEGGPVPDHLPDFIPGTIPPMEAESSGPKVDRR